MSTVQRGSRLGSRTQLSSFGFRQIGRGDGRTANHLDLIAKGDRQNAVKLAKLNRASSCSCLAQQGPAQEDKGTTCSQGLEKVRQRQESNSLKFSMWVRVAGTMQQGTGMTQRNLNARSMHQLMCTPCLMQKRMTGTCASEQGWHKPEVHENLVSGRD